METCYRHPTRETGVSCSSCGRPICPDCMTPTPVGMRCPECARQRTRVKTISSLVGRPVATYALMAINVVMFLAQCVSAGQFTGGGRLTADLELYGPAVANGDVWRLLTSGFLHASIIHIALNMWVLYILGTLVEPAIGRLRFVLIYFASLFAGSFAVLLFSPNSPTLGASGAIFGLLGAGIVLARHRGIPGLANQLWFWAGLNLLFTFANPGQISIGAHVGGFVGGGIAALLLLELPLRARVPSAVGAGLVVALGVAAAAGSVAVVG